MSSDGWQPCHRCLFCIWPCLSTRRKSSKNMSYSIGPRISPPRSILLILTWIDLCSENTVTSGCMMVQPVCLGWANSWITSTRTGPWKVPVKSPSFAGRLFPPASGLLGTRVLGWCFDTQKLQLSTCWPGCGSVVCQATVRALGKCGVGGGVGGKSPLCLGGAGATWATESHRGLGPS